MAIFLTILKWIGIILLVVLVILLLLLLLVLFVPIRYKLRAAVNDPESHEEFPLNVLKEQSDVMAEVTWFWGILKVLVQYPGEKLLDIRIFGKSLPIGGGGEEKEEASGEPEKEEKEEEEKEEEEKEMDKEKKKEDNLSDDNYENLSDDINEFQQSLMDEAMREQ